MAVKLHIKKTLFARFLLSRWGKVFVITCILALATGVGVFSYYYVKYGRMIEDKLAAGPFDSTSRLYAAPRPVMVGDDGHLDEIAAYLRRCGYTESNTSRAGWYHLRPDAIEINPGPDAFDSEGATIKVDQGKVTQIPRLVLTTAANYQDMLVCCVKNTNGPQDPDAKNPMSFEVGNSLRVQDDYMGGL